MTVKSRTTKKKARKPGGHSRAAQNIKIRREALREELKAREYIRQLTEIEQRLNPEHKKTYSQEDLAKIQQRTVILFRLLDKSLPNLRPVDTPVALPQGGELLQQGQTVIDAMMRGEISPQEATGLMQAITGHLKIIEIDDLAKRIEKLENAK